MITPRARLLGTMGRALGYLAERYSGSESKAAVRPWSLYEQRMYEALSALLSTESARLARDVAGGGVAPATDALWWAVHEHELLTLMGNALDNLVRFGLLSARNALPLPAIPVNWSLVNTQAVEWARAHTAELVTQVSETTRDAIRQAVAEWSASGEPLSALAENIRVLDAFSPRRAQLIAQTESTNAYASANARAWEAMGVEPAAYTPGAHVGCRCYLQPWRMESGRTVITWYTAHDERVCSQPLDTPWGEVAGCRGLHLTIVSRGDLMGTKRP